MRYLSTFILLCTGLALASPAADEKPAKAAFHVKPYLQLPTPTGMTIMWETSDKMPGGVEYGPTRDLGMSVEEKAESKLHQVRLEGLNAGTSCYYRVRSGDLVSEINAFKTAPPAGTTKWRMALYGDSRSNPPIHRKVAEQVAKANVDLILHTGDIVANGRNYESWRKEFFEPIAPIAGSVPWVSTIGNHEADSANYFSYMALPGNERFFGFDYANAHIVCLDSNGWIEKGRDSKQYQWMESHLKQPRQTTWTFIAFHHPLFSAHRTRPINSLRWDWAPLFLDPECRVDGVLTGHDHFYARNYPMARISDNPAKGVLFLTSAGGAASLYPTLLRDYIAKEKAVHHFTLFEFDGDQVKLSAIDITGKVIDTQTLTKAPTPPEDLCAYEIEELRHFLRLALAKSEPIETSGKKATVIDSVVEIPTRFQVPIKGKLVWKTPEGWKMKAEETPFELQPRQPLRIPLQAEVNPKGLGRSPLLTIEFEPGKFRNRFVEVRPFKLTGASKVKVAHGTGIKADGNLDESAWQVADPQWLLPTTVDGKDIDPAETRLVSDGDWLFVSVTLPDPEKKIKVPPPGETKESSKAVLSSEHVRVELNDGKQSYSYAVSAEQIRYCSPTDGNNSPAWQATAAGGDGRWTAELAIPLKPFADKSQLRINVVHRNLAAKKEFELRPTFGMGISPDVLPDWKAVSTPDKFAQLDWN